jgi:hypothetical protein
MWTTNIVDRDNITKNSDIVERHNPPISHHKRNTINQLPEQEQEAELDRHDGRKAKRQNDRDPFLEVE